VFKQTERQVLNRLNWIKIRRNCRPLC